MTCIKFNLDKYWISIEKVVDCNSVLGKSMKVMYKINESRGDVRKIIRL